MFKKLKTPVIIQYAIVFVSTILVFVFLSFFIIENSNQLESFQNSEIKNIASLVDLSKEINNYSKLTRDEIQLLVKKDFSFINAQLMELYENLENGLITSFQLNEIKNELMSLIKLNKSITEHLSSNEIELAQKLYKTEFLFHDERIHQLIDSTKKISMINLERKMSGITKINNKEKTLLLFSGIFILLLSLMSFYQLKKKIYYNNIVSKYLLQIDNRDRDIEAMKIDLMNVQNSFERLKLENLTIYKNIKSFKNNVNSLSLQKVMMPKTLTSPDLFKKPQAFSELEQKIDLILEHFDELRLKMSLHNQNLTSLMLLTKNLNKHIINFEINKKPIDVVDIKHLLYKIEKCSELKTDLNDFDIKATFNSFCNSYNQEKSEASLYLESVLSLKENIQKIEKENNLNLTKLKSKALNLDFELLSSRDSVNEKLI